MIFLQPSHSMLTGKGHMEIVMFFVIQYNYINLDIHDN